MSIKVSRKRRIYILYYIPISQSLPNVCGEKRWCIYLCMCMIYYIYLGIYGYRKAAFNVCALGRCVTRVFLFKNDFSKIWGYIVTFLFWDFSVWRWIYIIIIVWKLLSPQPNRLLYKICIHIMRVCVSVCVFLKC